QAPRAARTPVLVRRRTPVAGRFPAVDVVATRGHINPGRTSSGIPRTRLVTAFSDRSTTTPSVRQRISSLRCIAPPNFHRNTSAGSAPCSTGTDFTVEHVLEDDSRRGDGRGIRRADDRQCGGLNRVHP
ncbi:unnamed protein product, partial [Ixodes pacificus]